MCDFSWRMLVGGFFTLLPNQTIPLFLILFFPQVFPPGSHDPHGVDSIMNGLKTVFTFSK
jgi:hypothetical protein